jgi:shikimate kinase/3-dehydroquinate synthase
MRRPLLLNGFMATGKSTVGRKVAELTQKPFLDLDRLIEERAGVSIPEIFRTRGEAHFRKLEHAALEAVLEDGGSPVVALGGGALLRRDARLSALEKAVVITLQAPNDVIRNRVLSARGERPLLDTADPTAQLELLGELRSSAYAEAHAVLDTGTLGVEEAAAKAIAIWQRDPIAVAASHSSYRVDVGGGITRELLAEALRGASLGVLVTDETVAKLFGAEVEALVTAACGKCLKLQLPPGEEHKNIAALEKIWNACLAGGADRRSRFIGFGGGVVTDITGFAAASWMRGVPWISMPTTLLAMVDASVGGKTAVDLGEAKNAIGAFWQPATVICDVSRLLTESKRGFISALAEVVKTAIIGDPELFELLETQTTAVLECSSAVVEHLVRRSIAVKASIVSRDERESGLRAALNLGHTIGHALEAQGGYGRLTHGEAISLGLVAALRLGERLGETPPALSERVIALLARLGLPIDLGAEPLTAATELIGHDKKRAGSSVRFVVARGLGDVDFRSVGLDQLKTLAQGLA